MVETGSARYTDIIPLGRGGMGDVTLAVLQGPSDFSKLQVIKRLRSEISDNTEFLQMFLHEARLAARLSHPNIVQTNEVGCEGNVYFIAMEYLEGQTLHALFRKVRRKDSLDLQLSGSSPGEPTPLSSRVSLPSAPVSTRQPGQAQQRGTVPLEIGLRIVADALEGLHHAHEMTDEQGQPMHLVHRDVSPGNVFISYDGSVRLLDFGIAKAADSELQTRTGILKGKVPYMAPEQFRSRNVDRRCDLYAVGAILWELAAGVRLWHGLSDLEIVTALSAGGPPSPRSVNPTVHPKLEAMCMKALSLNADERYASAAALQVDVEALLRELGGCTSRAVGKYIASLFAQKRAQQQSVIESKLRELRHARGLTTTGGDYPSKAAIRTMTTTLESSQRSFPSVRTTGGITTPTFAAERPSSRGRLGVRLATGGAAGLAIAAIYVLGAAYISVRSGAKNANQPVANAVVESTASAPPTSSQISQIAPTLPADAPRTRFTVRASPADTKLFLDDVPLVVNPFVGEFPRDGLSHRLRAEANGFVTDRQFVAFSGETATVVLDLKRQTKKDAPNGR
jgi:serine/threonine protein kinase